MLSAELGTLIVRGRTIVGPAGPVRLVGVNRSGLEYAHPARGAPGNTFLAGAAITRDDVREACEGWGASLVRLPFSQERALEGAHGASAEEYLAALDQVIAWAASFGAYTLLDLQWLDDARGNAALPDARTPALWRRLAARYRDEPAVLFDLFNEPHPPAGQEASWHEAARALCAAVRSVHPDALIVVSGLDWGYDLSSMPLCDDRGRVIPGLVYGTHIYPKKGADRAAWRAAFGAFAERAPVLAAEWGLDDEDERRWPEQIGWGEALADYFDELAMGWAAWSWVDRPRLRGPDGRITLWGELARRRLALLHKAGQ